MRQGFQVGLEARPRTPACPLISRNLLELPSAAMGGELEPKGYAENGFPVDSLQLIGSALCAPHDIIFNPVTAVPRRASLPTYSTSSIPWPRGGPSPGNDPKRPSPGQKFYVVGVLRWTSGVRASTKIKKMAKTTTKKKNF